MSETKPADHEEILRSAPKMPSWFFGRIEYSYQGGKVVVAKVEQSLKPA